MSGPAQSMSLAELAAYRRQLQRAIAFFDQQHPVPPARDDLQARLDALTTEQPTRTGDGHA